MERLDIQFDHMDTDKYEDLRKAMYAQYAGSELLVRDMELRGKVQKVHTVYCGNGEAMLEQLVQLAVVDPHVDYTLVGRSHY